MLDDSRRPALIQGRLNFLFKHFMYAVFKVQSLAEFFVSHPARRSFTASDRWQSDLFLNSGARLLSQTVSSSVPSAARGLTVVFGMGTGVPPGRIGTGNP